MTNTNNPSNDYITGLRAAARMVATFDQNIPGLDQQTCRKMADGLAAMVESAEQRQAAGNPPSWSMPGEPDGVLAVRDRDGRLWLCPGRPGDNLWWHNKLGQGIGYEWHELLNRRGPLTDATSEQAEAVNA